MAGMSGEVKSDNSFLITAFFCINAFLACPCYAGDALDSTVRVQSNDACNSTSDGPFSEANALRPVIFGEDGFPGFEKPSHIKQEISILTKEERDKLYELLQMKKRSDYPFSELGVHISRNPETGKFHVTGIALDIGAKFENGLGAGRTFIANSLIAKLPDFPVLRFVSLDGSGPLNDKAYQLLTKNKNLAGIIFDRSIKNHQLKIIGKIPTLKMLNLRKAYHISDEGISQMDNLETLQYINIWGTKAGNKGASWLQRCDALERICIGESFDADWLKHLPNSSE